MFGRLFAILRQGCRCISIQNSSGTGCPQKIPYGALSSETIGVPGKASETIGVIHAVLLLVICLDLAAHHASS